MEIADIDESGTIDESEFKAFVRKLDPSINPDKCLSIFKSADSDQAGELSVEQFGFAIFEALKDMKSDEEEYLN